MSQNRNDTHIQISQSVQFGGSSQLCRVIVKWSKEFRTSIKRFTRLWHCFTRVNSAIVCLRQTVRERWSTPTQCRKAILRTIQDNGHVTNPRMKYEPDMSGLTRPHVEFNNVGIRQASIGTFACQRHEEAFKKIDTIPMDFEDPEILDLLLYRSVLREIWLLLRVRQFTEWVNETAPHLHMPSIHPDTRLESFAVF